MLKVPIGTRGHVPGVLLGMAIVICLAPFGLAQEPGDNGWANGVFGIPGVDHQVRSLAVWDDGTGAAIYAGGDFQIAGKQFASRIARWDGNAWSPLGEGVRRSDDRDSEVHSIVMFNDGSGSGGSLYAAGNFDTAGDRAALNVARWDGQQWSPVGEGLGEIRDTVIDLTVFDDGTGDSLYAAITPSNPSTGRPVGYVKRWTGQAWVTEARTVGGGIGMLRVLDVGQGPRLLVGGDFVEIESVAANSIASWDGRQWSPIGEGLDDGVSDVVMFDDGSGAVLYAGGSFQHSAGSLIQGLARWDGERWHPVERFEGYSVYDLHVHDDGSGPALYVGGWSIRGGDERHGLLRWDGNAWSRPVGLTEGSSPLAMMSFDDGNGLSLFAGGLAGLEATHTAARVTRWDGRKWHTLGEELGGEGVVYALETFDDGLGESLFAAGDLAIHSQPHMRHFAMWNGRVWSDAGGGPTGEQHGAVVYTLRSHTLLGRTSLYAGGEFSIAEGALANGIAKWDGQQWIGLDGGLTGARWNYAVDTLIFDDGRGEALFVAGSFETAGTTEASHIARWDGESWAPLGEGMDDRVFALAEFDDGRGPALYAGGIFTQAGGSDAESVARWDGTRWEPVGGGVGRWIRTMTVADFGDGPALYVGGSFSMAGGQLAVGVARWDGTAWMPVGAGLYGWVYDLKVVEMRGQPQLIAVGSFITDRQQDLRGIARWDGNAWHPFDRGLEHASRVDQPVGRAIAMLGEGSAREIYVGGDFTFAGSHVSPGIARWSLAHCPPDLDADGSLTVFDFLTFLNLFQDGDPKADFDGDGELTIFDFLAYQNAFDAGCP